MANQEIINLTEKWYDAYQQVLLFAEVDTAYLRELFTDSYQLLEKYSEYELVPKDICDLLCEMQDFSRWVSELSETPLHNYYREISTLVCELKFGFINERFKREEIKNQLDALHP